MSEVETVTVEPVTLDVPGVARLTGLGQTTVWQAVATGELPFIKVGRRRLVLRDRVLEWLHAHEAAGTVEPVRGGDAA